MKGGEKVEKQTMLYASRLLKAGTVKEVSRNAKVLFEAGKEVEANILLLRYAGKRSELILRKEVEQWQPLRKLG